MGVQPKVIISGFADEGPVDKKAESQLTMLAALGMGYYSVRFVDAGGGVKNAMQLTRTEVKRLRALHGEFGVQVSSLGSPIGKVKLLNVEDGSSNDYVPFARYLKNDVRRAVDLAGALETRLIRGFSLPSAGAASRNTSIRRLSGCMPSVKSAKKGGVFWS